MTRWPADPAGALSLLLLGAAVPGAVALDAQAPVIVDDSAQLRIFGSNGEYLLSIGRKGQGPGEFMRPFDLWVVDDRIYVWDPRLTRLTAFEADGALRQTVDVRNAPPGTRVVAVLQDESLLLRRDQLRTPAGREPEPLYSHFFLMNPGGELVRELPRELFARWGVTGDPPRTYQPLFSHFLQSAGAADGYWTGTTETEEVRRYRGDGRLAIIVRWPGAGGVPSRADLRRLRDRFGDKSTRMLDQLDDRPLARRFASHGSLLVDRSGRLWVQEYAWPGLPDSSPHWLVFDPNGVLTARLTLPDRHRLLDAREDRVLTVWRDDYDVQYVRLYELVRSR